MHVQFQIYWNKSHNSLQSGALLSLVGVVLGSTTLALSSCRSAEDQDEAMPSMAYRQADVIYFWKRGYYIQLYARQFSLVEEKSYPGQDVVMANASHNKLSSIRRTQVFSLMRRHCFIHSLYHQKITIKNRKSIWLWECILKEITDLNRLRKKQPWLWRSESAHWRGN